MRKTWDVTLKVIKTIGVVLPVIIGSLFILYWIAILAGCGSPVDKGILTDWQVTETEDATLVEITMDKERDYTMVIRHGPEYDDVIAIGDKKELEFFRDVASCDYELCVEYRYCDASSGGKNEYWLTEIWIP